jgi:hypothetical protein
MCPLTTSPKAWSYLGNLKEHIALIAKDYVIAHHFPICYVPMPMEMNI